MNPRAAINDLLLSRGPSASLGTSPNCPTNRFQKLKKPKSKKYYNSFQFLLSSAFYFPLNKRREWDSNPRALADKRFSRPPRYDHFDISPCAAYSPFIFALRSAQDVFYHQLFGMSIQKISFYQFFASIFHRPNFFPKYTQSFADMSLQSQKSFRKQ